jgi:membrane fusion protein
MTQHKFASPEHRDEVMQTINPLPSIFRRESLEHRQQQWLGEILITGSPNRLWSSVIFLSLALLILLFLAFGRYTRKEEVQGRVTMSDGAAEMFAPTVGAVKRLLVHEGETVKAGQPLLVVSTEKTTAVGNSRESMGSALRARKASLEGELLDEKYVIDEQARTLKSRVSNLFAEIQHLGSEITATEARFRLSVTNKHRFEQLRNEDVISPSEFEQHQQEALSQQAQLEGLRKQRASSEGDLAQMQADLTTAPLKGANALGEIRRRIMEVEGEIADNESNREITIPAEIDGIVTAVLIRAGQTVNPATPLLSLLPRGGRFVAQLYVPSKGIGFLKGGNVVMLRYEAFPYQKFGLYKGVIREVSRTTINTTQLQLAGLDPGEPLYRVTVSLDSQTVDAYGEQHPLQDGMRVEGDVLVDTRRLYEWVLDPLYTLTRR